MSQRQSQKAQLSRPQPFGDELTSFQLHVLVITHSLDKASGTEISNKLANDFGTAIYSGRFYPTMDTLDRKGLIDKVDGGFDDRTNAYSLTDEGEQRLREHILWEIEHGPVDSGGLFE